MPTPEGELQVTNAPSRSGSRSKKRIPARWAGSLLLVAISLAVSLLGAELTLRLIVSPPPLVYVSNLSKARQRFEGPGDFADVDSKETNPWAGEREEGWGNLYYFTSTGARLRPNGVKWIRYFKTPVEIRTNSLGYRNPEIGPKARTRVLFLGDSITLGEWLPEERTFVRRIDELSRTWGTPLETINAAVSGIDLATELAILKETGLSTRPDVVVLCFYLNDVSATPGVFPLPLPPVLHWSHLARHLSLAISILTAKAPRKDRWHMIPEQELAVWKSEIGERFPRGPGDPKAQAGAFNALVAENVWDWGAAWSTGAWDRMEPLLRQLQREAEQNDFRLLIVGFPVRSQVDADILHDYPQRRLAQIAESMEVPFLDMLPLFRRVNAETKEPVFTDHCHHTDFGQEVIANAILDFVYENRDAIGPHPSNLPRGAR